MEAIVFCECSERVTMALRAVGVDAWSCDLKPSEVKDYPYHIQGDARKVDLSGVKLGIFHPDCTDLTNSGVRWLHERYLRWIDLCQAVKFFNWCLNCDIPMIAVENPIHHKYARQFIREYDQIIQPWQYGDNESKATCLWLKGLPPLMPTHPKPLVINQSVWKEAPSENRKANRSRTFQGIANAMANQWGSLIRPSRTARPSRPVGGVKMIEKSKVSEVVVRRSGKIFVVFGRHHYGQAQKRIYKSYEQALKHSLRLSDYYRAPVIEEVK